MPVRGHRFASAPFKLQPYLGDGPFGPPFVKISSADGGRRRLSILLPNFFCLTSPLYAFHPQNAEDFRKTSSREHHVRRTYLRLRFPNSAAGDHALRTDGKQAPTEGAQNLTSANRDRRHHHRCRRVHHRRRLLHANHRRRLRRAVHHRPRQA
jgi:hypothetical protein